MDLFLLSPVQSSPKDQYQPAPIGTSKGVPYQLASDLQLSDDSDSEDNLASGKPEVVVRADYCHMPLLGGLTGDGVEITKENTDSISCQLDQLANDLQLSESSDSEDDSIKDLPLSNGQSQFNHVQFAKARKQSTDLMVHPSNTNFHAPMLESINSVTKDLELSDDSEDDFVEVQPNRVSNPQIKDMPLLEEFASEKDSDIMAKLYISKVLEPSRVVSRKLPPEIKTKKEHIANISEPLPPFGGRQLTKPKKVATVLPLSKQDKQLKLDQQLVGVQLDPLPKILSETSNYSRQHIENHILRGKALLADRKMNLDVPQVEGPSKVNAARSGAENNNAKKLSTNRPLGPALQGAEASHETKGTVTKNVRSELDSQRPKIVIISNQLVKAGTSTETILAHTAGNDKGMRHDQKPSSKSEKMNNLAPYPANDYGVTMSSGNPNQFDGRQTTKPIKVAATIPVNQLNKDSKQKPSVPSLDPLPENFTLPVARKVRTSNFSKQQIETQIARGKELLQKKVDIQLSSDCQPKPHKRNASQMLNSKSSGQEGEMSVEHIQVAEPAKKKQRITGKSVKPSEFETDRLEKKRPTGVHFKNKANEELLQKTREGKANLQRQQKPHGINVEGKISSRYPTQNDEILTGKMTEPPRNQKISKQIIKSAAERQTTEDRKTYEHEKKHSKSARSENKDIKSKASHSQSKLILPLKSVKKEQSPGTSEVSKFKTLRREYIKLMDSIKRPAYLALQLKDALEHKRMSGTKQEVVEIKQKILAIGKELKSESFQNQKRKLEQLEDQLESLKRSIKDSRKTRTVFRKVVS
ncbi:unnamed protein product [Hermetia illucens]|uniref:Uncharacterized protein n=1 Tax=Hermetia illucens TaxID=343691 RepID=A0A7R8V1S8_HERIL|nr:unnamed protein product [Hermetia illucens]